MTNIALTLNRDILGPKVYLNLETQKSKVKKKNEQKNLDESHKHHIDQHH